MILFSEHDCSVPFFCIGENDLGGPRDQSASTRYPITEQSISIEENMRYAAPESVLSPENDFTVKQKIHDSTTPLLPLASHSIEAISLPCSADDSQIPFKNTPKEVEGSSNAGRHEETSRISKARFDLVLSVSDDRTDEDLCNVWFNTSRHAITCNTTGFEKPLIDESNQQGFFAVTVCGSGTRIPRNAKYSVEDSTEVLLVLQALAESSSQASGISVCVSNPSESSLITVGSSEDSVGRNGPRG